MIKIDLEEFNITNLASELHLQEETKNVVVLLKHAIIGVEEQRIISRKHIYNQPFSLNRNRNFLYPH